MISDTNTPRYRHHRQDKECFHDPKLSLVLFPTSLIKARQPTICWSPEIRSIFQDFIKVRSCFHLCLTSFVCHNMLSVVAFCLFLNFLNAFLIIFRSFLKRKCPHFYNIYQKYMDTFYFLMLPVAFVFPKYCLFGCCGSQLWSVGYSSWTRNPMWAPCFGSVESQHQDQQGILDIHIFIWSLFFFSF